MSVLGEAKYFERRVSVHVNNLIVRRVEIGGSHEACVLGGDREGKGWGRVRGEEGDVGLVVPRYQEQSECQHIQSRQIDGGQDVTDA